MALVVLLASGRSAEAVGPNAMRAGFDSSTLAPNDDGSTSLVPLGFDINFFGQTFSAAYVNNNGNITFDSRLGTYTPFGLTSTSRKIIAPFFADVDTRSAGDPVRYGPGTVGARPAWGVTWANVDCYASNSSRTVRNWFQLVLIDRSDIAVGDFDIEFNYDQIQWETGQASGGTFNCLDGNPARVGYSNGVDRSFELEGSGVDGAFLDSNTATGLIHNSRNTLQLGRYVFEVRNGDAPTGGTIAGTISTNPPVVGAIVQACGGGGFCSLTTSNSLGQYSIGGLAPGDYDVTAFPPSGSSLQPGTASVTILATETVTVDIVLTGPTPPPAGTTITSRATTADGIPIVYWNEDLELVTTGCAGGTASYEVIDDGVVIRSGPMAEGPAGTYTATIPALYPNTGWAEVEISILCADGTTEAIAFDIYIDPSGNVVTTTGQPIVGATVTLFRSDSSSGPFTQVPDGSAIMSPANRTNPDTTDADGHFGWDVIAGYYLVTAQAEGCHAPGDSTVTTVQSHVMTIPPPVTDLLLVLECPSSNTAPTADAGGPYSVDEGSTLVLDGSASTDVDLPAGDELTYEWDLDGDGLFGETGADAAHGDEVGVAPTFSAAGLDGPSTVSVTLRVTDAAGASSEDGADVEVVNVAPTVEVSTAPIDEGGTAEVAVGFSDPGMLDTHDLSIDWGDGSVETVTGATSPLTLTHAYGDDGSYAVVVTVTDDDGGAGDAATDVVVANIAPSVSLDTSGAVSFGGETFFLGTVGMEQAHAAQASDAGSDDLTFAWSSGATTTYFNDGVGPDPLLSPGGTFPFSASDAAGVTFTAAGVHSVDVSVADDDGGAAAASFVTLITGAEGCTRGHGFWGHQFRAKGKKHFDQATIEAFLAIGSLPSGVFSEMVAASSVADARAVFEAAERSGDDPSGMRAKATREALAAWLNFASGGIGWMDLAGGLAFHEAMAQVEAILLNADATHEDLVRAKDIAEAINQSDACQG